MDFLLKTRMNLEGLDLATSSGQDSTKSQMSREAGSIPVSLCPKVFIMPRFLVALLVELKWIRFTYLQCQ